MKSKLCLLAVALGVVLSVSGCASSDDDRPIPGTLQATDTKKSAAQNNTPRENPTPNPDPSSQPPDSATQVIVTH